MKSNKTTIKTATVARTDKELPVPIRLYWVANPSVKPPESPSRAPTVTQGTEVQPAHPRLGNLLHGRGALQPWTSHRTLHIEIGNKICL